ncbi:MAG: hypothetical protein JWO13_498 [Acidobacteriales bacterium]|nr:hypothetical protein [Terriglobales bacterium]
MIFSDIAAQPEETITQKNRLIAQAIFLKNVIRLPRQGAEASVGIDPVPLDEEVSGSQLHVR